MSVATFTPWRIVWLGIARRVGYHRGMIKGITTSAAPGRWSLSHLAVALCVCAAVVLYPAHFAVGSEAGEAFFESKIRPLLVERCLECHGETKQEGGLRLDSPAGWKEGGDSGPALIPGKPDESLLITAVSYVDKDLQMPPKQQLGAHEIAELKEWIRLGAPDPRAAAANAPRVESDEWAATFQARLDWWSLQPLRDAQPPTVQDGAWSRASTDRFVFASLEAAGLTPAPAASPEVLLRRLAFVLTGLPPSPQLREKFLQEWAHDEQDAYEHLVDELLSSPHFGEHFARHWMDVVRYTDTFGYESDNPANGAWEYRDYLIRALNKDVSFDQLVLEQLAGDLLSEPRIDSELSLNESAIGPMFYHLGEHREGGSLMFNGVHQQMVDNKIDAFSKAFLGLTVACARCHDHKLEAVSQRDYYALAAVFMTPRWTSRVIDAPGKHDSAIAKLKELRTAIQQELAAEWLATANQQEAWPSESLRQAIGESEPKPEDVAYPLARILKSQGDVAKLWNEMATQWRESRTQRIQANAAFQVLAGFREPKMPEGWVTEGDGIQHGYVSEGTPLVALEGETVIERLLPRGYHTHALSSKLPGALRMPPQHLVAGGNVSLQLAGGEFSGFLAVQENGFKSEQIGFLKSPEPAWKTFNDAALKNGVEKVTVEFATTSLNPNFPPRIGLAMGFPPQDLGYDKRSWLSITGIVAHDAGGAPQDLLDPFVSLYAGDAPQTSDEAQQRIGAWLSAAVRRWCAGTMEPGDTQIVNWLLAKKLLANRAAEGSSLAALMAEYRRVEQSIAHSRTVLGMDERETVKSNYPLNVRGNVDVTGEGVTPDFLQIFAGRNDVAQSTGSGRLELAQSLILPDHPLTSRVYVNRVWQWLFGTGLVATPDDFGHLGEQPSHPELLDYLALEFSRDGWSTKRLVRRLVMSQTFRQTSAVSNIARQRDPQNRLWHHYPTRRLEAESIRDALLAVSGRFEPTLFGRPINPPRAAEDSVNKRLFSGPLDGNGRRSIYLHLSIMEPPKFLVAFNLPDLKLPLGKRDVTNVPTQSLILLNDPFVLAMARHWAAQLVKETHASPAERITAMFVRALGRKPDEAELVRWQAALQDFATPGSSMILADELAWERLAHALFNTKEFIYYR
jgi:hypothetical protein